MNYLLVVVTHGSAETLPATLASFRDRVRPLPSSAYLHVDGDAALAPALDAIQPHLDFGWTQGGSLYPKGFCESCRECWNEARRGQHDWVFWLEHDFSFARDVSLGDLASVLDANPQCVQMALRRQPVSDEEKLAGGYVAMRGPGYYVPRETRAGGRTVRWMEHRGYWTTNPSLFRKGFAFAHRWPDGPECEGRFSFQLAETREGTTFGVWGAADDEPWVTHTGVRSGFGY